MAPIKNKMTKSLKNYGEELSSKFSKAYNIEMKIRKCISTQNTISISKMKKAIILEKSLKEEIKEINILFKILSVQLHTKYAEVIKNDN